MAYAKPHSSTMNKSFVNNKNDQDLEKWNPMEDDYKNKNFNTFAQGPGADLDEDLQPGALANQSQQQRNSTEGRYRLVLKYVPKEMTKLAIRKLCSNYGKVIQVWENSSTPVKFVTFATLNDMTNALNKLKDNPYKIIVEIARESKRRGGAGPESRNISNSTMSLGSDQSGKENKLPMQQQQQHQQHSKLDMSRRESKETMENIKKLSESSIGEYKPVENCYMKMSSKNSIDDIKFEKCAYCAKLANTVCGGCTEYYCSAECQKIDWPRHRHHCLMGDTEESNSKKIDKILNKNTEKQNNNKHNPSNSSGESVIKSQNLINNYSELNNIEHNNKKTENPLSEMSIKMAKLPKSGSHIAVTTVSKPNQFYIRSMDSEDNVEYVKILNLVNSYAVSAKTLEKLPERGDVCITDFQETGYYRVLILNAENVDKIIVIYIDFGNVEHKKLSDLKEASIDVRNLKCYTISVRLKNIPDFVPTQKLKDYLHSYVDNLDVHLKLMYNDGDYNKNDGNVEVEIIDTANNVCLNKKILEMREIKEPKDLDTPIYKVDIEHKLLPSGKNIEVCVLDNSLLQLGYVSCILPKDMIPLQELTTQLKEYAEKVDGPYTPRQSELCVVQYDDDEWYRAECLEVVGDENPAVLFIDYGNMSPVHISKIRKYPKELQYHPCTTNTCMIADLPEDIEAKLALRLQELIPMNDMLTITEISSETMDDETNIIFLPEIVKILKAENLI